MRTTLSSNELSGFGFSPGAGPGRKLFAQAVAVVDLWQGGRGPYRVGAFACRGIACTQLNSFGLEVCAQVLRHAELAKAPTRYGPRPPCQRSTTATACAGSSRPGPGRGLKSNRESSHEVSVARTGNAIDL